MFTTNQIEEIRKKLSLCGKRDTSFQLAESINNEDILTIVQDSVNKKVLFSTIKGSLKDLEGVSLNKSVIKNSEINDSCIYNSEITYPTYKANSGGYFNIDSYVGFNYYCDPDDYSAATLQVTSVTTDTKIVRVLAVYPVNIRLSGAINMVDPSINAISGIYVEQGDCMNLLFFANSDRTAYDVYVIQKENKPINSRLTLSKDTTYTLPTRGNKTTLIIENGATYILTIKANFINNKEPYYTRELTILNNSSEDMFFNFSGNDIDNSVIVNTDISANNVAKFCLIQNDATGKMFIRRY